MDRVKKIWNWFSSKSAILAFLILMMFASIVFSSRNFFSYASLANMFRKAASDGGFLALGMSFVILIGQIDLSVGAVLAMSGVLFARAGMINPLLGVLAGLACGLICGLCNGLMVAKLRISSWIATLAMMLGVRGAVLLVTNQRPISVGDPTMQAMGNITFFGINILVYLLVIATLICMHISRNTCFGMGIYAVGGNEEAARMMGLKVSKIKIGAYICCGLFASIAGILLASRLYTAQPNAGDTWETTAIAMCALGGVKLSGGEGKFSGTFFGILIIAVINTVFNYARNLDSAWQNVIMGIMVLLSIGVQSDVLHFTRKSRKGVHSVSAS